MAHYAQLDKNNIVVSVIPGKDEEHRDMELILQLNTGKIWKRTSYNTKGGIHYDSITGEPSEDQSKAFRKNYAGVGYSYDAQRDAFIPPKPYASWTLNEDTCGWEPPTPRPIDNTKEFVWDESSQLWIEI